MNAFTSRSSTVPEHDLSGEKKIVTTVYALQAASFLLGFTYFIGILINYLQRPVVAGTWLESHFQWQINTFWYSLLWGFVGGFTLFWGVGYFIVIADVIWMIYRIAQGWSNLARDQPMYQAGGPFQS
ncbi:hypothetical protein [Methylococcus sp. EFPC2]|uniref:DUF4870 family protein n=1 Tax=Methylococcus sp. EFPC2 TaxID=2812648 RepID=UPI0019679D81|nr:hypothetical protein [Methylococcus sp. EFPC2]QSA98161.1 hypothetical protein JWZ97_04905 [Methylococcus sp. EFPC2]